MTALGWAGRWGGGGVGGKAKPLLGYETLLLHHPAGFVACGVGTLQLVECRLVYLSGYEKVSISYDLIRCAQTNVNYFPLKIT